MLLRFGRLRLRISFFFTAFLVLILAADVPEKPAVFFLSALLHEAGHLVCLLASGCRDLTVSLMPGGAAISGRAIGSLPLKNALIAVLAGPCVNLLLACALTVARSWRQMVAVSCGCGLAMSAIGLVISYALGLKPGGTIVLVGIAILALLAAGKSLAHRNSRG